MIGFTYTQDNIFIPHEAGSKIVNIHMYGWGALWPFAEGSSESDNGAIIDRRISQAAKDGQEVMLTCATAPSAYRQSGEPWKMEERVMESMEAQYAERCAQAVKRWPQITRVQVWNELKGYWSREKNRWDHEDYTRFYNTVYDAVKAVRPEVKVGGGYIVLSAGNYGFDKDYGGVLIDTRAMDAMRYWLEHAQAYDAVCLDGSFPDPGDFVKVTAIFRPLSHNKPIWWSEYYSGTVFDMREARKRFEQSQRPGDIALWWAESRFTW